MKTGGERQTQTPTETQQPVSIWQVGQTEAPATASVLPPRQQNTVTRFEARRIYSNKEEGRQAQPPPISSVGPRGLSLIDRLPILVSRRRPAAAAASAREQMNPVKALVTACTACLALPVSSWTREPRVCRPREQPVDRRASQFEGPSAKMPHSPWCSSPALDDDAPLGPNHRKAWLEPLALGAFVIINTCCALHTQLVSG